jgi:gliding motility-associated lipoprotein GldH
MKLTGLKMNKIPFFVLVIVLAGMQLLTGCDTSMEVDTIMEIPKRNWTYVNKVKAAIDVKEVTSRHNIYFKLRHTADYRYSNIYVLFHLKKGGKTLSRRYEYRLAQPDGQWNGSGSGNLYTYKLPLLTNYSFGSAGRYELEIEQNMRDNPLKEISDVGISISKALQ